MPVALGKTIKVEMLTNTRTLSKEYYRGDIIPVDYVTAVRWEKFGIAKLADQNAQATAQSPLPTDLWAKDPNPIGQSESNEILNFIKEQGGEKAVKEVMEESQKIAQGEKPPEPNSRAGRAEKVLADMKTISPAEAEKRQKKIEALEKARRAKAEKSAEVNK